MLGDAASHKARRQSLQAALIEDISRDYATSALSPHVLFDVVLTDIPARDLTRAGYNVKAPTLDDRVSALQSVRAVPCVCGTFSLDVIVQVVEDSYNAAYNKAAAGWSNVCPIRACLFLTVITCPSVSRMRTTPSAPRR